MTTFDEPHAEHDLRCPELTHPGFEPDPSRCTCRDDQGHAPRTYWSDGPMCGFDLETTAPDPTVARLVTSTTIRIRPGHDNHVTNWLSDVDGEDIPDGAAEIHSITTAHAHEHGRPLAEVVDEVRTALELEWAAGIPVVGHNVSYDLTVMAAECRRFRMRPFEITGPVVDTIVLDRGADRYRKGKRTLTATCEFYGVTLTAAHEAEADALAAARVAWHIAHRYPLLGQMPLKALQKWQADAHRRWAEGFGKYLRDNGKTDDVSREWPMRGAS